jgi:hypothetical protein
LKEEKGDNVTFGDNSTRIVGNNIFSIDNGKTKTRNVLYFEGLKNNILCVIQIHEKCYNLTFNYKGCEIMKTTSRRLLENENITSNDVYILNEVKG